jgi:hypothetical protein
MSSSDVASAVQLKNLSAFFILSLWRPARRRCVDPEYEVRHSGIAVRAAERWSANLTG